MVFEEHPFLHERRRRLVREGARVVHEEPHEGIGVTRALDKPVREFQAVLVRGVESHLSARKGSGAGVHEILEKDGNATFSKDGKGFIF